MEQLFQDYRLVHRFWLERGDLQLGLLNFRLKYLTAVLCYRLQDGGFLIPTYRYFQWVHTFFLSTNPERNRFLCVHLFKKLKEKYGKYLERIKEQESQTLFGRIGFLQVYRSWIVGNCGFHRPG